MSSILALFKARIVALLLLAATGGAFLSAGGWPGAFPMALLVVVGGLSSAGSAALNEFLERRLDARMRRTSGRPLVAGPLAGASWVPALGVAMVVVPVAAVAPVNPALALFSALGAVIYVGVYTLWLKPRTAWNIVVGGAAGSCAVLAGGAAAGQWTAPTVLGLALLVFLWTPIHFWSLALVYREDYAAAGVPMLPVITTERRSAFWALLHGVGCGTTGLAMALHPGLGPVYLAPVALVTALLLWQGVRLVAAPTKRAAWRLFHTSNLYLAVVLLAAMLDAIVAWQF